MRVVGSKELERMDGEQEQLDIVAEETAKIDDQSVASYIMDCWEKARRFKEQGAEPQILKNMRQIDGEYEADKLKAIKEVGGSEVFMMITDAKCKNAKDWVNDIIFHGSDKPYGIQPSPLPELPDYIQGDIEAMLFKQVVEQIAMSSPELLADPNQIQTILEQALPEIKEQVNYEIMQESKKLAKEVELKIEDRLLDGKWYDALRDTVQNVILHTGILKGPVLKKRILNKVVTGPDGRLVSKVTEDIIPTYESRHPLYIYPAPGSTDVNDGYLIDRIKVTPLKLQELIGVPGYDKEELLSVLEEAGTGRLKSWLNLTVDQDISDINNEITTLAFDSDKIDCLEFWGYVYGDKIIEWGLTTDINGKPLDENTYYNISAYLIGNHVIKIAFNNDQMGRKPFYRASFEGREGSFWGKGLPEIIADCQQTCNAVARAIANNAAMGSGPQVERNIDRIPSASRDDNKVTPWKVWDVTDGMMMSNSPAIKFYQPPMVVERLMNIYTSFSKIADEHSGVPAYAHGDSQVGGAGNTASGLSILMASSARGIKALVSNIDRNITAPSVTRTYQDMIAEEENFGMIFDYNLVTLGSAAALMKEQLSARRIEFMQATANPYDMQIIGPDGRKYLLEETARSMQLDVKKVFPPQMPAPVAPENMGNAGEPTTGPQTLDAAGNPVVGQDTRTANQGGRGNAMIEGRQHGGDIEKGQTVLVGETGPELVRANEDGGGYVIPLGPRRSDPGAGGTRDVTTGYGGYDASNIKMAPEGIDLPPGMGYSVNDPQRDNSLFAKLSDTQKWESSDARSQGILDHFVEKHKGDWNAILDETEELRKKLPYDLGVRNVNAYAWSKFYNSQGINPVSQVANAVGYQLAKNVMPDPVYKYVFGKESADTSTPRGGSIDWTIKGIGDLSIGDIMVRLKDAKDRVVTALPGAPKDVKEMEGSGYAKNIANAIKKRNKILDEIQ